YQIRLRNVVNQARSFGAVSRDPVIGLLRCVHRAHCANGYYVWIIARGGDSSVAIGMCAVVASKITGGDHYNKTRLACDLYRLAKRVLRITLINATSQGKIDYAALVSTFESNSALDGSDHARIRTCSIPVQNLQVDDVDIGGDAEDGAVRTPTVTGDDSRNVRTVAVAIANTTTGNKTLAVNNA